MQALALAAVACMALYCYTHTAWPHGAVRRFMRRTLWVLLAIYLLSPALAFSVAFLPLLFL